MKITKSQLQQIIKEELEVEMRENDPLVLLVQADLLAKKLGDPGTEISTILNRIGNSMNYESWQQMTSDLGGQE